MDPVIYTSRLKLMLVTKAERGSDELEALHTLFTNKQSTWWSIYSQSKSIEDTEKRLSFILPINNTDSEPKSYRVFYAVHRLLDDSLTTDSNNVEQKINQEDRPTEFIGSINLKSLDKGNLPLPEQFNLPASSANTTLTVETAYMFLPSGWGKGYATEAIEAMYEACQRASEFWSPYSKLYVRALVNSTNPASLRVMDKVGMADNGVYVWRGEAVFLAGKWREEDSICVRGKYLLE